MADIWVVVADSSRARILSAKKANGSLAEIRCLDHPEGRMHAQELTSDLPGRAFDSGGQGRHAMSNEVDPKRHELIRFAKEIAEVLESGLVEKQFGKLYLMAPPAVLGQLRSEFSPSLANALADTIDKNLTGHKIEEIRRQLPDYL